jgi:hypothetical protein
MIQSIREEALKISEAIVTLEYNKHGLNILRVMFN